MKKTIRTKLIVLLTCIGWSVITTAQTQKGSDIEGEAAGDQSGYSVSVPDANTLAIGAILNDDNGVDGGHVRVYSWNGSAWQQKGSDIDAEAADDWAGYAVSMPDANTLAIGAPFNDGNGNGAGHVRIYSWDGSAWTQKGADIDGEVADDRSGRSVSMPDANTVAIGAEQNSGNGLYAGHVRIYEWDGSAWIQKGADIDGEAADDYSGWSVSMPDAFTVAIGAHYNDGNGSDAGHVRVYEWNGNSWEQKGADIDGEAANDLSGHSVSMPDNNTVAIGAHYNDGNGSASGHVRIYEWNGSAWMQKGSDIDGDTANDWSGYSISMSDASTLAIGAPFSDINGIDEGQVRIYSWNGSIWNQQGVDIFGEIGSDNSGFSVSMSEANTLAIGARYNDGNGIDAGHVRVFDDLTTGFDPITFENQNMQIYPNPSNGILNIECGTLDPLYYAMKDINGKLIETGRLTGSKTTIDLSVRQSGMYILEISFENQVINRQKIIRY